MSQSPNNFSRFWQELRRRKVLRSLAIDKQTCPDILTVCEKEHEDQDASIPYVGVNLFSKEPFKIDDPRFNELLKKMNLPLPRN